MRKLNMVIAVAVFMLFATVGMSQAADSIKIGYVDFNRIQSDSKAGKQAVADMEIMFKAKQKELDERQSELENNLKALDKQSAVLSASKKKEKEEELQKQYKELQRFKSDSEDDLNKKKSEVAKQLYEGVQAVINKFGKEEGYTLILERSIVLYATDAVDVTDQIITKFDAIQK